MWGQVHLLRRTSEGMSGSQSSRQERLLGPISDVSGREGALLHREPPPGLKVQADEALTTKSMSKQREKHLKAGSQSQQKDGQPVRNLPQVQAGPGGEATPLWRMLPNAQPSPMAPRPAQPFGAPRESPLQRGEGCLNPCCRSPFHPSKLLNRTQPLRGPQWGWLCAACSPPEVTFAALFQHNQRATVE